MPRIVIDKLLKGHITDYGGTASAVEGVEGQFSRNDGISMFRSNYFSHITPAETFSNSLTNAEINSVMRNVAVDITNVGGTQSSPFLYAVCGGLSGTAPRIVRMSSTPTYDSYNAISAHAGHNFTTLPTLYGTGFWGEDTIFYTANSGTTPTDFIFTSYNDNTDGDVASQVASSGSLDSDWMSTQPVNAAALSADVPHRMAIGSNQKLYITNGRYVSEYDGLTGTNGTFNATRYDGGSGWFAVDVRRFGDRLAVAWAKCGLRYVRYTFSSEIRVTIWDMSEPGLGLVFDIDDNYITALFLNGGRLYAFTGGKNGTTKIWYFRGSEFSLLPGGEQLSGVVGTPPDPRSIEWYNDMLVWIPGDALVAQVCAYSLKYGGFHMPYLLNNGTDDTTGGTANVGFLKNINGNRLYSSSLYSGTYSVNWLDGTSGYASNKQLRTRIYNLPFKANIQNIRVYFSQLASGGSVQLSLFKNWTTLSVGTTGVDFLNKTISYSATDTRKQFEFSKTIPDVSAFWMNIKMSGQVSISRIEIDYVPSFR